MAFAYRCDGCGKLKQGRPIAWASLSGGSHGDYWGTGDHVCLCAKCLPIEKLKTDTAAAEAFVPFLLKNIVNYTRRDSRSRKQ